MNISFNQKKNYILYTSIGFITGAILYFSLPYISYLIPEVGEFDDSISFALFRILGGGYLIMSLIATFNFASYIYPQLPKTLKILSIIFFMFTFVVFTFLGYLLSIPFYLFCIYSLTKK